MRAHAEVELPPASPHDSPSPNPHTRRPGPELDHSSGKESRSRREWEARKREELHRFLHIPRQHRAVLVGNKKEGRQNPCIAREEERRHRQQEHRERKEERMESQEALGRGGSQQGSEEIVGKTYQFCLKKQVFGYVFDQT